MLIDVYVETPISKYRLFLFDLLVMALQLLMLSIKAARQDIADKLDSRYVPPQDHDSEERGENRADREADEEEGLMGEEEEGPTPEEQAASMLYSGEIV